MPAFVAFLAGVVFALGLALSGMTVPAKVIGFLDITGAWDPSLAFVMVGAIGVHAVARRFVLRRGTPLGAPAFDEPSARAIDVPLVVGAAIFGVGWGIAGYCPGPAIATLGAGSLASLVFVGAMAAGMELHRFVRLRLETPTAPGIAVRDECLDQ